MEEKTKQLHLDTLIDIAKSRKWFKSIVDNPNKTLAEEQILTEVTFDTDLIVVKHYKKYNNEK